MEVTRTELSADPVKKMGKVGCQSTVVIAALCGRVLNPFERPRTFSKIKMRKKYWRAVSSKELQKQYVGISDIISFKTS